MPRKIAQAVARNKKPGISSRHLASGALDTTFGDAGAARVSFDNSVDTATALTVNYQVPASSAEYGKILVVGTDSTGICIAKLNTDGTLDTSFGNGGKVANLTTGTPDTVDVQSDQSILVHGVDNGTLDMRLLPDGQLDPTYGTNGVNNDYSDTPRKPPAPWIQVAGPHAAVDAGPHAIHVNNTKRFKYPPVVYVVTWGDGTADAWIPGSPINHGFVDSGDFTTVVTAYSAIGEFSATHAVSVLPAVETTSVASGTLGTNHLTWTNNAKLSATRIEIQRSTDEQTWKTIASAPGSARSFDDRTVPQDTLEYYRVRAQFNNGAESIPTVDGLAFGQLPAPTELRAHIVNYGEIDLSWKGNTTLAIGYAILRAEGTGPGRNFVPIDSVNASTTTYSDLGINSEETYAYEIAAEASTSESQPSNVIIVKAQLAPTVDLAAH